MKGVNLFSPPMLGVSLLLTSEFKAILAGGALRDLNAGIPLEQIKDLDFFIPFGTPEGEVAEALDACGWSDISARCSHYFMKGSDGTVEQSIQFSRKGQPDVNVIWMAEGHEPLGRLNKFDFGACQIAWDGRDYHTTSAFFDDMANYTFTLIRADTKEQFDRSMQRWDRISKRYDGWRLIVPRPFIQQYTDEASVTFGTGS